MLGHSFGGQVALEYALRYPDRLSHLILLDTGGEGRWLQENAPNLLARQGHSAKQVELVRRWFNGEFLPREYFPIFLRIGPATTRTPSSPPRSCGQSGTSFRQMGLRPNPTRLARSAEKILGAPSQSRVRVPPRRGAAGSSQADRSTSHESGHQVSGSRGFRARQVSQRQGEDARREREAGLVDTIRGVC